MSAEGRDMGERLAELEGDLGKLVSRLARLERRVAQMERRELVPLDLHELADALEAPTEETR